MKVLKLFVGVFPWAILLSQPQPEELFRAIRNNDLTYLAKQLAKGTDINTRDRRGSTLLMSAAAFGSADAVQMLLDSGADVNAKNSLDNTALIWAATDRRKVALLIAKDADVNARSNLGRTPVMIASTCEGCSDIVRMLLKKGADPKVQDKRGFSAARLAAEADGESLKLLLETGASPMGRDTDGMTPLHTAAGSCNLSSIKLLLSKGADVNAANTFAGSVKFGKIELTQLTPLMMAAPFCPAEITKALLDAGAEINKQDGRGMTALMLAIGSDTQDPGTVRLLIRAGTDVNAKTKIGETALDWAMKYRNPEILTALRTAGALPGEPFVVPERTSAPSKPVGQAVQDGVALLQRSSTEFFKQSGCVGCHHQVFSVIAAAGARPHGIHVDDAADRDHVKMIEAQWTRLQGLALERVDVGGGADQEIFSLLALGAANYKGNEVTDSLVSLIASFQASDGSWRRSTGISRPPLENNTIPRTAFSIRVLQLYGSPAQKADFEQRIARARTFLLKANLVTNDDAAMQIVGLYWAGAGREILKPLAKGLIAMQQPNGGWAGTRYLSPDAFATGQALWALREAGVLRASDDVYQRGVKFLLATQWQDGSWYVRSRAPKFQPYFQSGFPYDHDQWISSVATAWALMALAPAVEVKPIALSQ